MRVCAEYIWIDGTKPVPKLRSKTKIIESMCGVSRLNIDNIPEWGFDGSSTGQADGNNSDCVLKPVKVVQDPLRVFGVLVLCEVFDSEGNPHETNKRALLREIDKKFEHEKFLFGIEQEYTFFDKRQPLGWPADGYPAAQGPFYCGIGADEVFGRPIVEKHMKACMSAGLDISGINAEVMPGQWEYQIGPCSALDVSDNIWLSRYLLYRIAEEHGVNVKLDPKPVDGDWNGAGAHTNFSTKGMRCDFDAPLKRTNGKLLMALGYVNDGDFSSIMVKFDGKTYSYIGVHQNILYKLIQLSGEEKDDFFVKNIKDVASSGGTIIGGCIDGDGFVRCIVAAEKLGERFAAEGFPKVYGNGYERRLTGQHETCSYKEFKFGISDRTASVRIPLHVKTKGMGYIEDRRPCANIDPYEVTSYIIETVCG